MNSSQLPTYNESFLIPPEHSSLIESDAPEERFILARLAKFTFAFPSESVAGILLIDRAQILALPLYNSAVIGVVHSSGKIVPLVSLRQIINLSGGLNLETLTAIHLSESAGKLAGLGVIVDTTLGMSLKSELPSEVFTNDRTDNSESSEATVRLFQPELLDDRIWKPRRWQGH
jgi:chemotaxis signal transduction protein